VSSRRALLGLFAAAAAAPARAFRLEPLDPAAAEDWAAGASCGRSPVHDELRAEIVRLLDGRMPPQAVTEAVERLSVCPHCRCRIAVPALSGS
jgi:hypothetical protein